MFQYIVVGFFWNILLVAIRYVKTFKKFYFFLTSASSAIFLLVKWVLQNKRVSSSIFEKCFILNHNFPQASTRESRSMSRRWREINVLKLRAFERYDHRLAWYQQWSCRFSHLPSFTIICLLLSSAICLTYYLPSCYELPWWLFSNVAILFTIDYE